MNILFIASWYPSRIKPTLGNFIEKHTRSASLIHHITVISAIPSPKPLVVEKEITSSLYEVQVYYKNIIPILSYFFALKKAYAIALKKSKSFKLIHVHVTYAGGLLALYLKKPFVITEHFTGYLPYTTFKWPWLIKKLAIKTLKKAQRVLPVSHNLGKAIQQGFAPKTPYTKVSNVVDTALFKPSTHKNDIFTFLHISSLNEETKNISGLLKAIKAFESYQLPFKFLVGGDGDLNILKKNISKYQIAPENIETFGMQTTAEVAKLMQHSHCFVLSSHIENQPVVILEALSCGLPIISTNVGGINEEVTSENGILISPNNYSALTQAMYDLYTSHEKYHPLEIAKKAHAQYSYQAVAEKLSKIYSSVLNGDA